MLHRLCAYLLLLSAAPAAGFVVEDLNRHGWTLYYSSRGGNIFQFKCKVSPSSFLPSQCSEFGRMDALLFRKQLAQRCARHEQELRDQELAFASKAADLQSTEKKMEDQIRQLETVRPKPWNELRRLVASYVQNRSQLEKIKSQQTETESERQAYQLLVSTQVWISDGTLHVFGASLTPIAGNKFVAHLDEVFAFVQGQWYGRNTWWDRQTGRVLLIDFTRRPWREASQICPFGYSLIAPDPGWTNMRSLLARLADAYEAGETVFEAAPAAFWGWQLPTPFYQRVAAAYVYRPWSTQPIGNDATEARHATLCLSQRSVY